MATNWDTHATWIYHDATKHTSLSVRSGNHVMDMTNQPRPWKLYSDDLPKVQLNRSVSNSRVTALDAMGSRTSELRSSLTLDDLGTVLLLSAGVTKTLPVPGGFMRFRAAACTGALYHIELYVVTRGLEGLAAGVYHYGVHDNSLRMLREGDFRQAIEDATAGNLAASSAEALIVYTTTYWRNAWKYASRAYRHAFWDAGTVMAHTLAIASARNIVSSVLTGFADGDVNRLIGVTPDREAAVAIVTLGIDEAPLPHWSPITDLAMVEIPLSRSETFFPAIIEMHQASSLTLEEMQSWSIPLRSVKSRRKTTAFELPLPLASSKGIEETIVERGSSRRFDGSAVSKAALATILTSALAHVPLDARTFDEEALVEAFVIVNAVDDLDPGAYAYDQSTNRLHQLKTGETRDIMSHLALDQSLGGNAAFNIYFLADLNTLLPDLGNRAYRAAHLDASIAAGRAYLAAYSLELGATGLTFYDDEVIAYLGREAQNLSVMFLLAVGNPIPRSSH
jgi:SagB-type dehydrogenase family enzyme